MGFVGEGGVLWWDSLVGSSGEELGLGPPWALGGVLGRGPWVGCKLGPFNALRVPACLCFQIDLTKKKQSSVAKSAATL